MLTHIAFGMCCSISTQSLLTIVFSNAYIPLQWMVKIFPDGLCYFKMIGILFCCWGGISVSTCSFWGSSCTTFLDTISLKNTTITHLKWHLLLFSFKLSLWLCISIIFYNQDIICNSKYMEQVLEDLILFSWSMLLAHVTLNDNLVNIYLSNWHAKGVRYDDFFSGVRLW